MNRTAPAEIYTSQRADQALDLQAPPPSASRLLIVFRGRSRLLWGVVMPLLVMKFGGTSVADLDRIKNAAQKVKREVDRGYNVIVIVSAMSGKTNELVGWVEQP